jgi:DNA-binding NarL/FixJ family response regulator
MADKDLPPVISEDIYRGLNAHYDLTKREVDIIAMQAFGFQAKEIAARFCCSLKTISSHITNLHHKLGMTSIAEVTMFAVAMMIVPVYNPVNLRIVEYYKKV